MNHLVIRQERIQRGWTQGFIGERVGLTKTAIHDIETGKQKPSYNVLVKLENLFGLSHRYLLAQIGDAVQGDCITIQVSGEDEARELYDAANWMQIDAETVIDITKDGRLDDLERREKLIRARDAINAVLGEVA